MSGTSTDGIDCVAVNFENSGIRLIASESTEFPSQTKDRIEDLISKPEGDYIRLCSLDIELAELYAERTLELLTRHGIQRQDIQAIGCHGQTIYHHAHGSFPFSCQLGKGAVLAERTGILTINDFRAADIAAGGQGAPLAPAFHRAVFHSDDSNRCIVNIGGISNITWLPKDRSLDVLGFDTGPGNTLMDSWTRQHHDMPFDENGSWAASGAADGQLLQCLLNDPYFSMPSPKSTGREKFNMAWLRKRLQTFPHLSASTIQATLLQLSCASLVKSIGQSCPNVEEVCVCGGGVHNQHLMTELEKALAPTPLRTTESLGIHPDWVEAMAFAWLARQCRLDLPGNIPSVTQAKKLKILGALWPADSRKLFRKDK